MQQNWKFQTKTYLGKIPLIRIRNPWGNETEWNGPWSDGSAEWRYVPDEEKEAIGLNFETDGEFFMSYKVKLNSMELQMSNFNRSFSRRIYKKTFLVQLARYAWNKNRQILKLSQKLCMKSAVTVVIRWKWGGSVR